ncbi:hypothetical protein GCM10018793_27800 [Streptomyces sulfonofaciens]|uniref:Uncharacterized protein n=1 Tax=Streptomyces sulfonofaciens TaxID=68272 RepID=A0A919G597_9ACTN|nr:hypothetical protein [Streptomyces sulfonofaciens]GHH78126.1 hypothetical protein GCM10018793_27800 [Streptomyces sulfonofaciens]
MNPPDDARPHGAAPEGGAAAGPPTGSGSDAAAAGTPDPADLAADAAYAHETAVRRADAALRTYTLSEDGWRAGPSATLQRVLADLLHWCDDTQRDFDAVLGRARALHGTERRTDG